MPRGLTMAEDRVRDANSVSVRGLEALARRTRPSPVAERDGRGLGDLAWDFMAPSRGGAAVGDRGGDRLRRRDSGVGRRR